MRKIYFLLLFLILLPYGMKAQDAYPSTVKVSFSQNGQTVNSVPYGSTVTITATMEKAATVTKAEQTAPTGTFLSTSSTENSITVTFTDVTQTKNENGIEIAYAVEPAASEPTSNWTTAEKINTSTSYNAYNATIDELSLGTPYIFFARYKGNDTHEPSPAIASSSAFYTEPKIITQSLPNAYVGVAYSQKLEAEAGEGVAVSWVITSSTLPDGLTLNSDGNITGTPTTPTTHAVSITVTATVGEGFVAAKCEQNLTISVIKSDAELGGLTVSGQTGFEGHFQYGNVITVTFTPQLRVTTSTKSLEENTATLTYTPAEGEAVTLATATAGDDGSFTLTYDTKEKKLPIGEDLSLTVAYGGSDALNPVTENVTLSLDKAHLKNMPTVTGSFVYGGTLTLNYTPQDDETVSYQWWRIIDDSNTERIDGATGETYTLTESEIGESIYVIVSATDEWHRGAKQSDQYEIGKASLDEDAIEITTSESTIELGSEGAILTAIITGIEDVNKAENWIWESSNKDIVEVNRLTPEAPTPRSADNPIESTARVTPKGVGTAAITVIYDSPTYHGVKTYEITVKEKEEEEPEEPVTPDYPDYYNIYVEECEGVTVETSTNVVREGNSMSFTVEVAEGYTAENMTVKVKRSLFGYTDVIEPNEEGKYEIRNIYTEIYITVEGVEKETPTGIEEITGVKVYTKDGSLYVQTPKQEQVVIISISGAVIKNETQIGLQRYDLPRGIYIICIGGERVKVRI